MRSTKSIPVASTDPIWVSSYSNQAIEGKSEAKSTPRPSPIHQVPLGNSVGKVPGKDRARNRLWEVSRAVARELCREVTSPLLSPMDHLLDIAQAAERLNVTPRFVRRLIAERRIDYLKIGKFIRFHPTDLDTWIEHQRIQHTSHEAS